jgi:type II secretory pathway predicted ATPase ExeA
LNRGYGGKAAMYAADHLQLQANPFTASTSGARIGRPLQAALGEVIRQIGLEAPVVVVCGNAGTGKTLLMNMIARACTDMGLCARQIVRGDLMHVVFGQSSDVLLIDEADSITDSTLHALVSAGVNTSTTTMIFLCRPSNVRRFTSSGGRAVIIELAPLMHSDARNYLLERATSAGRPDLFEVDALDLLIDGSRGSPRALRSIASLAFFAAAVDGSSRIGPKHVADALASQIYFEAPKSDQTPIPTTSRGEVPIPAPMIAGPIKASSPAPAFAAPVDGSPRIGPKHVADALASQIYFEAPKSDQATIPTPSRGEVPIPAPMIAEPIKASSPAPVLAESAFAAAVDRSPRIGPRRVADALASQIYFEAPKSDQTTIPTTPHGEVPIPAPMIAGPVKASSPAPVLAQPASDLIPFGSVAEARKKFGAARPRSAVWIPRLVGVTTALAASIAIAEGLPSRLFNSIPGSANIFNGPPGEARAVPRLGFVSFVPRPPAVPPRDASNKAETAKQTADIAKALKEASTNEAKPVASAVPARKATTEQAQAIKKPVAKGPSDISNLSKPAKDSAERAALAPLKETASPPAAFQELAYPAPAPKEVAALTEELKQEESPQAAAAQVLAVLPPAAKQKETDDRAKAEEMALARAREAVLAKVAADRAQAAKQAEERAWAARQAAMRVLSNSLLGIRN